MMGQRRLCVFNPEHDLCLANGNRHFVPPASALAFARTGASLMLRIYPDAIAVDAEGVAGIEVEDWSKIEIVPWGWDACLKQRLLKAGVSQDRLLSDEDIEVVRKLQHRGTIIPIQEGAVLASSTDEVVGFLAQNGQIVMKAPWSGAGRGLRWVSERLSEHDRQWIQKIAQEQGGVVVEPRRVVQMDFALEYFVRQGRLVYRNLSLFENQSGVYRRNLPLKENEIAVELDRTLDPLLWKRLRGRVEEWIKNEVVPYYEGPLGVDFYADKTGRPFLSEINFRHTMGMVYAQI